MYNIKNVAPSDDEGDNIRGNCDHDAGLIMYDGQEPVHKCHVIAIHEFIHEFARELIHHALTEADLNDDKVVFLIARWFQIRLRSFYRIEDEKKYFLLDDKELVNTIVWFIKDCRSDLVSLSKEELNNEHIVQLLAMNLDATICETNELKRLKKH